ncbi:hypothetical protein OUZ56_029840 [Daphnia magna]|uniref:Uncharacterized protein n=1 Tax=Daphnia magna TaxID=35525 RepID=A0ABR0B809_9CRUS|nr:hypothetical protein OUZ56_029840 [Daphnia magna]
MGDSNVDMGIMDKLGMINYLKRLEKTQNVLKCSILEHFLNWKSITRSWLTSEVASSINCEKKIGHELVTVLAWRLTEFRPLRVYFL